MVLPMKSAVLSLALACAAAATAQAAKTNSPAPDFTLMDSSGKPWTLSAAKGKIVVVDFWASWCAPCLAELPLLNKLAIDERGKNVSVAALNADQERGRAVALLSKLGLDAPEMKLLWDPGSKIAAAYDPETMPTSFILDAKGTVRFVHAGFHKRDPEKWREEIETLLREPVQAPAAEPAAGGR